VRTVMLTPKLLTICTSRPAVKVMSSPKGIVVVAQCQARTTGAHSAVTRFAPERERTTPLRRSLSEGRETRSNDLGDERVDEHPARHRARDAAAAKLEEGAVIESPDGCAVGERTSSARISRHGRVLAWPLAAERDCDSSGGRPCRRCRAARRPGR
jgi:hypothetical protein